MGGLLGSRSVSTTASRISSFQVTSSSYGSVISLIFGTTRISGTLIDYVDFTAVASTTTTSSGGKGGSVNSSSTTYTYTVGAAIALGEGKCTGIGKIWKGSSITDLGSEGMTLFDGSVGQSAWGYMLTNHPERALGYSGTAYVAGVLDLGDSANMENYNFEYSGLCQSSQSAPTTNLYQQYAFQKTITISNWSSDSGVYEYVFGSGWVLLDTRFYTITQAKDVYGNNRTGVYIYTFNFDDRTDGYDRADPLNIQIHYVAITASVQFTATDANPRDIMYQIMTNQIYACKFPTAYIDDWSDYSTYCQTNSLLLSPAYTSQSQAKDAIDTLMEATNSELIWSQGKAKIIPYYDGLTPIYDITDDKIIGQEDDSLVTTRTSQADVYNCVPLEYLDRVNDYNTQVVYATDLGDIDTNGILQMSTISHHEITVQSVAQAVAQVVLQKQLYIRNTYVIKLGQEFILLEPMDPVTLTVSLIGFGITALRVVSIKESGTDYTLEITLEDNPTGTCSAPEYETQNATRATVNYNVDPGNTNNPAIFEPDPDMTTTGLETWIAASGNEYWGGCNVWLSDAGTTYKKIGTINSPARYGTLTANFSASSNSLQVQLYDVTQQLGSGTTNDAQNLRTICWVDGEAIAYTTATLTGEAGQYILTGLVRGAYNTTATAHISGSSFVRCDEAIFKYPFDKDMIGLTVYFKITAFNIYGSAEQSLADVEEIQHIIDPQLSPFVTGISVVEHFLPQGDGTILNDLLVYFTSPNAKFFDYAEAYLKSAQPAGDELDVAGDQLNASGDQIGDAINLWKDVGSSIDGNILIQNLTKGQTYTIKLVSVFKTNQTSDFNNSPTYTYTIIGKTYTPQTPSNLQVNITDICVWTWNALENDVDFVELRTDQIPGEPAGLMAKILSTKVTVTPPTRSGTVYLYAHNTTGQYSFPCFLSYNKPAPSAPTNVNFTDIFQGLVITCDPLPVYCLGINIHANDGTGDKVYFSPNNSYNFKSTGGIYDIQVAYVDLFGEGTKSAVVEKVITATIDPALLAAESLSLSMMDGVIQDAITNAQNGIDTTTFNAALANKVSYTDFTNEVNTLVQVDATNASAIQQTSSAITSTVATLNLAPNASGQYSAISQLSQTASSISSTVSSNYNTLNSQITQNSTDITSVVAGLANANTVIAQNSAAIQLRATSANLLSLINVCPEAVTIKSSLLHIAADTLFDNNVIVTGMLSTGCVTANKIVASVSLTSPTINGGTIIGGRIQNVANTAYIDASGNIVGVNITAATIDATTILTAGYQIKTCSMLSGTLANGGTIPLPSGYTQSQCVFGVTAFPTTSPNPTPNYCFVNQTTRVISAYYDDGTGYQTAGSAYYWIMGVK